MRQLSKDGELNAYEYDGFWQCMDTKREHDLLDRMIQEGKAKWMVWA
jgi:glucose-1-phosphate cytidylyltransferase